MKGINVAASGPIDKANQKIDLVSRLVTATYAEFIQSSDRSESEINKHINAHINANPFLLNESIFNAELKKYQNRWDKLALILQRVLGTKEVLDHYLRNSEKRGILPESSVENMRYLQDWCENKFEREDDYKAFELLLRDMLAELYLHEGNFYNYTPQMILCAEIRVKFNTLAAQPLDTKYLYLIFSSYQNLWLNKQKVLEPQQMGVSGGATLHTESSSSSCYNDVQVDVITSISLKTNKISEAPPPPPLPLLPLWKATCSSSASSSSSSLQDTKIELRAAATTVVSVNKKQLLSQAQAFQEKRKQKMSQAGAEVSAEQVIEQEILDKKKAKPVDPREAYLQSLLEKSAEKASRRKGQDFEAVVTKMRLLQIKSNAAQTSCHIATPDSEPAETDMPASSSNSNNQWVDNFFQRQRAQALGGQKSDDESDWSDDDDCEDKCEDKCAQPSAAPVLFFKIDKSANPKEPVVEDPVDVTEKLIEKVRPS